MLAGLPNRAVATLAALLEIPSPITRELLRADPRWAPLRSDPRFRALTQGGGR
ncbi:MAG: hypothetical protein ACREOF_07580 [Gemmatimonadales bacterium]